MKKIILVLALFFGVFGTASAQELTPNTQSLNVSGFLYLDTLTGHLQRYQAIGFYETPLAGVKTKVLLMPHITVKKVGGVSFIGKDGKTITDEDSATQETVSKIRVALRYDGSLPDQNQMLGVISQIYASGDTVLTPRRNMVNLGIPTGGVLDGLNLEQRKMITDSQQAARADMKRQTDLLAKWKDLSPQVVGINAVRIKLLLDGALVSEQSIPAYLISGGTLPDFYVEGVDDYQINRFKERQFQVRLDFSFKDAKTGSIVANFDFEKMMNQIVHEERITRTSSSQSGVQFLGFGKRKSKMSQFMKESSDEKIVQDNKANTVIQMNDADESMMAMLESKFFPEVSREQVIKAHLEAAKVAESAGNAMLAKAHLGYAKAVQEQKLDLDVDTAGAMASLAAGDYAGFIAKGVKMQKSESSGSSQFSRVVTKSVDVKGAVDWTLVKSVSTQRTVSQIIELDGEARKPYLGLCHFVTYNMIEYGFNPPPKTLSTIVPTCIDMDSPLARAGIAPGVVIKKVDGRVVTSTESLVNALADHRPGQTITIQTITNFAGPGAYHPVNDVKVKLGRGLLVGE